MKGNKKKPEALLGVVGLLRDKHQISDDLGYSANIHAEKARKGRHTFHFVLSITMHLLCAASIRKSLLVGLESYVKNPDFFVIIRP